MFLIIQRTYKNGKTMAALVITNSTENTSCIQCYQNIPYQHQPGEHETDVMDPAIHVVMMGPECTL